MPKAAAGRGEKTTAASAVIPKITPIVRMTLAPYEALIVGHLKVRTTINVPFLPLVPTVADEMRKQHRRAVNLAVIASRMSAFGVKQISLMFAYDPKQTSLGTYGEISHVGSRRLSSR